MKCIFSSLLLLFLISHTKSQNVETLLSHSELRDGLHVDASGNIYIASGGLAGFGIGKYDVQTKVFDPNFATGFIGPVDVDQYQDSLLIVTNYDNNTVYSHNLKTRKNKTIAAGLDGPSGIVIDGQGNIFVASWGNAPAYAGHQIHKITPSGQLSLYIDSPLLYRPQAMTRDVDGAIVIHSNEKLYKVNPTDSTLQQWVNTDALIGHMVFRERDSCIYATANNKVLKIRPNGEVIQYAGSVAGYQDGPVASAKFKSLLGIELSPDENTLYVCDSGYGGNIGRLRQINLNSTVGIIELDENEVNIFPNPATQSISIDQGIEQAVRVEIFDTMGKKVLSKTENSAIIQLNTSSFSSGAYLIKMNYSDYIIKKKFIKP